jgi:outer membrane receptor protein involved in Fe transport
MGPRYTTYVSLRELLLVLILAGPALAQTSSCQFVGLVTDPSGAAVPGAEIEVRHTATGVTRKGQTNELGHYRIYPLAPGLYDITVRAQGFKSQSRHGLLLELGATLDVPFRLELGDVTESIEVTAAAPLMQTQEASVGGVVAGSQLDRMPVNGRNYTRLIVLMAGTSDIDRAQGRGAESGTIKVSVNGQRTQDNNYTLDGMDNNFMHMNSPGGSPPMDAIQEFRVATNNSAEYGRSAGANVNIAIKSGTRDLHGTFYEYLRNDKLDANPWFNNRDGIPKTPFKQNQYGLSLGGPVLLPTLYNGRDKTFWFVAWEDFRSRRANTLRLTTPTAQLRAGNFAGVARIYDPLTTRMSPTGALLRQRFPGDTIPASRLNPAMKALVELLMPAPNQPGLTNNFVRQESRRNDRRHIVVRVDHVFSSRDNFFARWLHQRVGEYTPNANPNLENFTRFDVDNIAAGWSHVVGPSAVVEVRYAYHHPWNPTESNHLKSLNRNELLAGLGIKLFEPLEKFNHLPGFEAVGWFGVPGTGGGNFVGDFNNQGVITVTKMVGSHSFKVGINYTWRQYEQNAANPTNGTAQFFRDLTSSDDDPGSGDSFATLLLGYPSYVRRGTGIAAARGRQHAAETFIQDDWRVTGRLTVNLGLRYEFHNAPYDANDKLGNLLVLRDPVTGRYRAELMWAGVNPLPSPYTGEVNAPPRRLGYGRALKKSDYNDFAPRVGIAYQLSPRLVIRAGFGIFYNSTFMQEFQDLRKFWPYLPQQELSPNRGLIPDLAITDPGPPFTNTAAIGGWPQNPNNRSPYSQQWNLFLQRQVAANLSLEIGYVGASNKKQVGYHAWNNALRPEPGPVGPRRLLASSGFTGNIEGGSNVFNSEYNALQFKANRRLSGGFLLLASYTYSNCMTDQSSLAEGQYMDFLNRRLDWGRASFDIRHAFKAGYAYDLPFGRQRRFATAWPRWLEAWAGGWSLEGLVQLQTGTSSTVVTGEDRANVGSTHERPNVLFNPNLQGRKNPDRMFATEAFVLQPRYTWGNAGVGIVQDDGRYVWDLAVAKTFALREGHTLEFRTELFNFPNHVNFVSPREWNLSSKTFAQTRSATAERQIQFALRYRF